MAKVVPKSVLQRQKFRKGPSRVKAGPPVRLAAALRVHVGAEQQIIPFGAGRLGVGRRAVQEEIAA
jgi:hypothetical protein